MARPPTKKSKKHRKAEHVEYEKHSFSVRSSRAMTPFWSPDTTRNSAATEHSDQPSSVKRTSAQGPLSPSAISDASSGISPLGEIRTSWKANSRAPIARISYALSELPDLYLVEVEVGTAGTITNKVVTGLTKINSRKLRYQALREFVKVNLADRADLAIDLDARKGQIDTPDGYLQKDHKRELTNHFIIPFPVGHTLPENGLLHPLHDRIIKLHQTKKEAKKIDRDNGNTDEAVYCRVVGKGKLHTAQQLNSLYAKSMDILFRTYASKGNPQSPYGMDVAYLKAVPDGSVALPSESFNFKYQICYRPVFEKCDDTLRLHVDLDLVPSIPGGQSVTDLLRNYFSSHGIRTALGYDFKSRDRINEVLCGLRVYYNPPKALVKEEPTGQTHGMTASTGAFHQSPTPANVFPVSTSNYDNTACVIRDIKPANQVGHIYVQSLEKYQSVKKMTGISPDSANSNLPLANIGGKRAFWVPLDQLHVAHDQVLSKAGHLFTQLCESVQKCHARQLRFRPMADDEVDNVIAVSSKESQYKVPIFKKDKGTFSKPSFVLPVEKIGQREKADRSSIPQLQALTIIYVTPLEVEDLEKVELLKTIRSSLNHKNAHHLIEFSDINVTRVDSVQDLIRQQTDMESPLMSKVFTTGCTAILGVIDRRGVDNEKYREIQAEIRRFGDRKPGVVTMSVEQQSLQRQLARRIDLSGVSVFPRSILYKMNYMLGNMTWNPEDLETSKGRKFSNLMLVGAHIAHPDSRSTDHCPSVAAVVSSVTEIPSIYPGSARVQNNRKAIVELEEMMTERLRAWKAELEKSHTRQHEIQERNKKRNQNLEQIEPLEGPHVLFFRGAYDAEDDKTYDTEIKAINNAYLQVFPEDHVWFVNNGLSYVVVTKNLGQYIEPSDKDCKAPFTFTTSNHQSKDSKMKYQYHVAQNGVGLKPTELSYLTRRLNKTSQLNSVSSIALPVHFARKLSHRVFDYFRFWSHKDIDNLPGIARQTPYNEKAEDAGNSFLRYVREYLEHDALTEYNTSNGNVNQIRGEGNSMRKLPWKPSLDNTMFYL